MHVYRLVAYDRDMVPETEEVFATPDLAKAKAGTESGIDLRWEEDERLAEAGVTLWSAEGTIAPGRARWFEVEEFPVQGAA
jgi:hypothetical protein